MKSIKYKILACITAAALVFGMCPSAALANSADAEPSTDNPGNFTPQGAKSASATTNVDVIYGEDIKTDEFAIADQIATEANPLFKKELDALNPKVLWVSTQNGSTNDADYTVTWKRVAVQIPANGSGADIHEADVDWSTATDVTAADNMSITKPAGENVPDTTKQFNLNVSGVQFQEGYVYFYRATVACKGEGAALVFPAVKIIYVDRYHGNTIEEAPWQVSGHNYDNTAGTAAQAPNGSILNSVFLDTAGVDENDASGAYAAIADAINNANSNSPDNKTLQSLASITNVFMDGVPDGSTDPAYQGSVLVTYTAPSNMTADDYKVWWNYGGTTVEVPAGGYAPANAGVNDPKVGYFQVNKGKRGAPDTITFLIQGTASNLGTFGIARVATQTDPAVRFTVTSAVAGEGGAISPVGPKEYMVGDGIAHIYELNANMGYRVAGLMLGYNGAPNGGIAVPGPCEADVNDITLTPSGGNSETVKLGHWDGNRYTLPSNWCVDATLTVTFEKIPDTSEAGPFSAALSKVDGEGSVELDGSRWDPSSSAVEFDANEWLQIDLFGQTSPKYIAQSVKVTYTKNGNSVTETFMNPGTAFAWKMTSDVQLEVVFAFDSSTTEKAKHTVRATWNGADRGWASFDGMPAQSGVFTQIEDGGTARVTISTNPGWKLVGATQGSGAGALDLMEFVKNTTAKDADHETYSLSVLNIKSDTTLSFTFDAGDIIIKVPTPDGGTISPSGDQRVSPGKDIAFTVTPDEGKDIGTVTINGKPLDPQPEPKYDVNGNPTYEFTLTYDQLKGLGDVPHVEVTFVDAPDTCQVIFDNPKANSADTVTIDGVTYDVYTTPLKLADGTTGTARFYMTPKAGTFAKDAHPQFVFNVLPGTTGYAPDKKYAVDELTLNGTTSKVEPAAIYVEFGLSLVTHFSVTLREAGANEEVKEPEGEFLITGVWGDTYRVNPSRAYMKADAPWPIVIETLANTNKKVKNVIDTVLLDGNVLYSYSALGPSYDADKFEVVDGAAMRFRVKATGEVVTLKLAGGAATLTFDKLAVAHTVDARTFRGVDVYVQANTEGGTVVPNGDVWWEVDEERTAAGAVADSDFYMKTLTLYVASKSNYELKTFTVNGKDRMGADNLKSDSTTNDEFTKLNSAATAPLPLPQGQTGVERLVKTLTQPSVAYAADATYNLAQKYTLAADDFASINTNATRVAAHVRASFVQPEEATHTLMVEVEGGNNAHGKIAVGASRLARYETQVENGLSPRITFVPETGYRVSALTDNGTDVLTRLSGNTYTVSNMRENHTVKVTFAAQVGTTAGLLRDIKRLQALAATGDLNAPAITLLLAVACGAIGFALVTNTPAARRRKEK